jgi:hypothetical protein
VPVPERDLVLPEVQASWLQRDLFLLDVQVLDLQLGPFLPEVPAHLFASVTPADTRFPS